MKTSKTMGPADLRQPRPGEWVTVNPDPEGRKAVLFVLDEEGDYPVADHMELKVLKIIPAEYLKRRMLYTARSKDSGELFIWPVDMPVPEDHPVHAAMEGWVAWVEERSSAVH